MSSPHPLARPARWQRSRLAAHASPAPPASASPLDRDARLRPLRSRLDELRAGGRLDRVTCDPRIVADGIHLASMNFRRAVRHLDDPDVAIVFLYQSVVNTADTALHCLGHHARDYDGHKLALTLAAELVAVLQGRSRSRLMAVTGERLRKRRHEALYTRSGVMTPNDVRAAVDDCRAFLPGLWALAGRIAGVDAAAEAAAVA